MKKYLFLFICFFQTLFSFAQTNEKTASDYKFALKIYSNVSINKNVQGKNVYNVGLPTFAFQWNVGKKNWQSVELMQCKLGLGTYLSSTNEQQRVSTSSIALKYEYNWNFLEKPHRLTPSIGIGATLGLDNYNSHFLKTGDKYDNTILSLKTFVTPRLTYNFTPKLFGELSLPIEIYNPYMTFSRSKTASLNAHNSTYSTSARTFAPRVGIGYRF